MTGAGALPPAAVLARLLHSYDIRGPAPQLLDAGVATALGAAFASLAGVRDGGPGAVVAHDMRATSPALHAGVLAGLTGAGVDVVDIGLAPTEVLYFASGRLDLPGVVVTASHNPPSDNGMKFCRAGARPIGAASGLSDLADHAAELLRHGGAAPTASPTGTVTRRDLVAAYAAHVRALVPVRGRRLRVVVDAANAMAAVSVPVVFAGLDVELVPLFFELDGRFPNHPADPLDPANLVALQRAVTEHAADAGLAFDGDADRCFVVDERGDLVSPSVVTALITRRELAKHPGSTVVHNVVCSRVVPETILAAGGRPVRTPVGHSTVKAAMAQHGAIFGGEHSGHYYFRDFWNADSGMLAALHVMAAVAESPRPLSQVVAPYRRYAASGEVNLRVPDVDAALQRVRRAYAGTGDTDVLDGLTVSSSEWWFNLRPSNTEPLLRLNVEADSRATMERVRDGVLSRLGSER